jgi:hypothetical protein
VTATTFGEVSFGYYSSKKNAMKKINSPNQFFFKLILAPLFLVFVTLNAKAQDVTAKDILALAAKATLDKENIATARGTGIQGSFTAVKMPRERMEDLRAGFYAGILELEVTGDNYGALKSGKYNLFFKNSRQGLKAYLEENGSIKNVFNVSQTTPENVSDTRSTGKPELVFPEQVSNAKTSGNANQIFSRQIGSPDSYTDPVKPHMWVKVCGKSCYWVQVY